MWFTILDPRIFGYSRQNAAPAVPRAIYSILLYRLVTSQAQLRFRLHTEMVHKPKDIREQTSYLSAAPKFVKESISPPAYPATS
jgi:hypothetical protein